MSLTQQQVLQALEDDMLAHHRPFASLAGSRIHPESDCFFYESKVNFGAFGGILAQRLVPDTADQRIRELNTKIKETGKDIGWVVSSVATPSDIIQRLAKNGCEQIVELKGMVLDLADLPVIETPPGLTIRPVDDESKLEQYARIYPLLFHVPVEDWIEDLVAAEKEIFKSQKPAWNRWIAYLEGEPVAAGRTGVVNGIGSLQILCTLAEHRNKGIGQALATHGLRHEARDTAIVWAGPDADRLYSRMGYREICRTSVFVVA